MHFRLIGLIGILAFLVSFVTFAAPGNAQAALTLNNFYGAETGGGDELISSSGSPTWSTLTPHSGTYAQLIDGTDSISIAMITGGSTDSDNDFITGFWVRFNTDKTPTSNTTLVEAVDDTSGIVWSLILETDSDLTVHDANGAQIGGTIGDPFTLGVFFLIEIRWQHSASGAIDLHIDGSSEVSATSQDLTDGGAISEDAALYRFNAGDSTIGYSFDDFYAYSGGTGTGDFLGDAEVFRYQNLTNSTTGDAACAGITTTINAGVWDDVGKTPLNADSAIFSDSGDGASIYTDDTQSGDNGRHGPHGDANIDGTNQGGKWLYRLKRGSGGGSIHTVCFGNDGGALGSATVLLTTAYANFFTISEPLVPTSSEHYAHGMHTSGARDIDSAEMWSFILHVPVVSRRIFPVH